MKEETISTMNELYVFIREHEDKGFYFRGENKDHNKTACLPPRLRNSNSSINDFDKANEWFQQKLEDLGVGLPYSLGNDNITNAFINTPDWRFRIWGEEKLEALIKHYSSDLEALKEVLRKTDLERMNMNFLSSYLDITSDIFVALHFSCSEYHFLSKYEDKKSLEAEIPEDGFLFLFDKNMIKEANSIRLIWYPSYAYFYKKGDKMYYQPFDRITHQRDAFLAPKRNEKGELDYQEWRKEIQETCLYKKIIIGSNLKKELYEIFGKERGLEYYFPKIPGNEIRQTYENLQGITLCIKRKETP